MIIIRFEDMIIIMTASDAKASDAEDVLDDCHIDSSSAASSSLIIIIFFVIVLIFFIYDSNAPLEPIGDAMRSHNNHRDCW